MKSKIYKWILALSVIGFTVTSYAQQVNTAIELRKANSTIIDLAGHQVAVLKGGLYDRFRSNPPLNVIAEERPDIDLSWFKTIYKEKKKLALPLTHLTFITVTAVSQPYTKRI